MKNYLLQSKDSEIDYWNKRGANSYKYKNEKFYTVTPIPFYYERRKQLLNKFIKFVDSKKLYKILDFGCGDGYYIDYLDKKLSGVSFFGCDISHNMIERAKQRKYSNSIDLDVSKGNVTYHHRFDLIYSFAVFAHIINDNDLFLILQDITNHLNNNGYFVFFEAVSRNETKGKTWKRREPIKYIEACEKLGLKLIEKDCISFPFFRFYELIIRNKIIFLLKIIGFKRVNLTNGNHLKIIQFIDLLFLTLSKIWPLSKIKAFDGNMLFVFIKNMEQQDIEEEK